MKRDLRYDPLSTQFNPRPGAVKERFLAIMDMTKKKRGALIIAAAALIVAAAGFAVSCNLGGAGNTGASGGTADQTADETTGYSADESGTSASDTAITTSDVDSDPAGLSREKRNLGVIDITSAEFGGYRDSGEPDTSFTLNVTDLSGARLDIVTNASGEPFLTAIAAKGQSINLTEPLSLQGNYNVELFECAGVVVFDKLYYNAGDTLALYEGGSYEVHNGGYDGNGNPLSYFGVKLYDGGDGQLHYYKIANKYDMNIEQFGEAAVLWNITDRGDLYSSTGTVLVQSGELIFTGGEDITAAERFDLDNIFAENAGSLDGIYADCKTLDDIIAVNKEKYGLIMTEFTDESWAKLNFDGKIQEQCREFFYNFVSGKSEIPEYNALGVTDWKITRADSLFNMYPSFIFEFTVTGDSIDALPPGHYVKYVNDIRWTVIYDDTDRTPMAKEANTDNEYARMVYSYLVSAYIWDCRDFGDWGDHVPVNYIVNYYSNGELEYDTFLDYAKKLFGIDSVDESRYSGLIMERNGVKLITPGGIGGGFYANIPEVKQNGGNYEVTVQLYADINGIIPSHTLRYTLGAGGEFLKFEIVKLSAYEPDGLSRYYTSDASN